MAKVSKTLQTLRVLSLINSSLKHPKMHSVTPVLEYLWHLYFHPPFPSPLILPTQLLSSLPPQWAEPNQQPLDFTYPSNSAEQRTCLGSETYKPPDRIEGEYQTVSVCVSVHPHPHLPPPSGGPSHGRQKQWIRLPSETMTEGLIFKVFPLTIPSLLKEPLCDK